MLHYSVVAQGGDLHCTRFQTDLFRARVHSLSFQDGSLPLFISQFLTFQSVKPSFLEEPRFYWKVRPLEIIKSERVQFHCNGL